MFVSKHAICARLLRLLACLCALALLASCLPIAVTVSAPADTIAVGGGLQLTATVSGTQNAAVTWSIDAQGAADVGSINDSGRYTAPQTPGTYTVRATSAADPTVSGTAVITVMPLTVTISVNPANPTVAAGGTLLLSASVAGTSNPNVTWETSGGGIVPGNPSATATFTAPAAAGTVTVTARSVVDSNKSAVATITVAAGGQFAVTPSVLSIAPGGSQQFTATLAGEPTAAVSWSLVDGAAAGGITPGGLFTAGTAIGTYQLKATLNTDATKTATVMVTVSNTVSLQILPSALILSGGDAGNFASQIDPSGILRDVTWTSAQGAAAGGITTDNGVMVYTPPAVTAPTVFNITAVSVADPSKTSTATVTVNPPPGGTPLAAAPMLAAAMATERMRHAAVALQDGRILITGGAGEARNNNGTTVAEMYTPATRGFATLANASGKPRSDHTATLLADGRVLLTGGETGYDSPDRASAEVFDPATGGFTPTANSMSVIRGSGHRAVRLETGPHAGKVLVLGGGAYYHISEGTASADLYDPATNAFSAAPNNMRDARTRFALTKLQDGRYLITGGSRNDADRTLTTAEIFNPADMSFTRTAGNMKLGRFWHTATLLSNGKVLIAGGYDGDNSAELFDPATGLFTELSGKMQEGRFWHSATLQADGRVRIVGGRNTYFYRVLGSTEYFDPATNTFSYGRRLALAREQHSATIIGNGADAGRILIVGGSNGNAKASAELLE